MSIKQNKGAVGLVVFDWDGTLMDSQAQIVASLQAANDDLGLPAVSADACRNIIGLGLVEAVRALYDGCSDDFVERYCERYRHHWFGVAGESTLFPGARETLELLQDEGYLLAVATGKSRRGLDKVLEATGLTGLFAATRAADETVSKPHPRMLNEIIMQLGVRPAETLMVGDTEYDLQMANAAGAGPVAVSYGVHHVERLLQHSPLACLDSIGEFPDWLAEYQVDLVPVSA